MQIEWAGNGQPHARVTRTETSIGRWEVASRRPHPSLRPHVIGYVGLKSAMRVRRERHLPSGEAALVINLGVPHNIVDRGDRSRDLRFEDVAVMGVHDRPFFTESDGRKHLAVVRLTPPGARQLLGVAMEHLLNRWVSLEQIDKPLARLIAERAPDLANWNALFSFLDAALFERLRAIPSAESAAGWAWGRLHATSGRMSIKSLLGDLDLSHKQLLTQFRGHVGLLPKATGELVRFNRVLRRTRPHLHKSSWAALAQECSYHDQAHMIREFKTFAHGTPNEIRSMVAGFTLSDPT
jgi:AraC-like DNA-binding protein